MNNLLKFIKLPLREKVLFFQAAYYLLIFRNKLVQSPPKILFTKVAKAATVAKTQQSPCPPLGRIAGIINQASRIVPYSTCLSKALAASVLFVQNFYAVDLHIDVLINEKRQLEAHAWLSHNGKIVLGNLPNLGLYQELPLKSQMDTL